MHEPQQAKEEKNRERKEEDTTHSAEILKRREATKQSICNTERLSKMLTIFDCNVKRVSPAVMTAQAIRGG